MITVMNVTYTRGTDETEADFKSRARLEVSGKPLIVFSQPTDPSPPFVIQQ